MWIDFLKQLAERGGSKDMQTSATGRYPYEFHFKRGQIMKDVVIYAHTKSGMLKSPPRDWSTEDLIKADYKDLKEARGFFNDSESTLAL